MPKCKLSAEERAAKQECKEKRRDLMASLEVKDVSDIKALMGDLKKV